MTEACDVAPAEILAFWRAAGRERWYERDDTFDADVRSRFLELWRKAAAGELSSWETTDEGALALVIILDQFPRNMFRGDIRTYSSDALAREVAGHAIVTLSLKPMDAFSLLAEVAEHVHEPEDRDVHDPNFWQGKVLFSEPEKAAFKDLVALSLQDSFRLFDQPEKSYSWWDYRTNGFKRSMGLRIDHILLSAELAKSCQSCTIESARRAHERPSDHAPVLAEIDV